MRTSPHAGNETFHAPQLGGRPSIPSSDTRDIIRVATAGLERIWQEGFRYMKAGIMLSDFFNQGVAQLNLFDEYQPRAGSSELMQAIDKLNQSGRGTIWFAGQGIQQSWAMKREMLSPGYTTRYADLPVAK